MANVTFEHVNKTYTNGYQAIKDLSLEIQDGEFMVLVGPSGCGKSTALRMLAGLEDISEGQLRIGGQVVNEQTPQQRNIAMVFQNYALYPHMTVRQNLEFPLRMKNLNKGEIQNEVIKAAQKLGLESLLDRKPKQLSGGQRQRVAMGRAIVRNPAVFLMDEPLSNLDAKMRTQIRTEIADLQRSLKTTTVYVTHDQVEAMTMGDRVAVMNEGKIQQVASPQDLYDQPVNEFVAHFIGSPAMNIFETILRKTEAGTFFIEFGEQSWVVSPVVMGRHQRLAEFLGQKIHVGVRPESFFVAESNDATKENFLSVQVDAIEALGHEIIIHAESPVPIIGQNANQDSDRNSAPKLIARLAPLRNVHPGTALVLEVDTSKLYFFTEEGRTIQ
jgi:multiple sugar transport system ATP-binding protein